MNEKEQLLSQIHQLEATIRAMESSKFWQIRRSWFRLRQQIGIPNNISISMALKKAIKILNKEGVASLLQKAKRAKSSLFAYQELVSNNNNLPFNYENWIVENEPDKAQLIKQVVESRNFLYSPTVSVITPVYNPLPEVLWSTIESVVNQTYSNWQLCLVDGQSTKPGVREVIESWVERDKRICAKFLDENLGIAKNSNEALEMASGEFIALLDHDDFLAPFALFEVAKFLNQHSDYDVIYSDEDKIEVDGRRHSPFFKPDWSPDLLQCFMYIGHLTVYRRELIEAIGGFHSEFDFSQDYDLALRVTEKTNLIGHIPKVLYHWQIIEGSAAAGDKPYARASNIAALASAIARRGHDAQILEYPTANRVKFKLQTYPLVSIIIPSDSKSQIFECLQALLKETHYPNREILVVTNTSLAEQITQRYSHNSDVRPVPFDAQFNFSAKCNRGAEAAKGEYLLFLNDDVRPLDTDWIECMLEQFQQDEVGAVSPKLIYPTDLIQHAGLVTGVRGFVGTAFHQEPHDSTTYFNLVQSTRTVSALSAACLLMRKDAFMAIGGFDEVNTPIMHSDLDLCFKVREKGLRLVYTPFTVLKHIGHASLGEVEKHEGRSHSYKADLYLLKRWGEYLSYDPYYPDNMRALLYRDSPTKYRMYGENQFNINASKADLLFVTHDLSLSGAPLILNTLAKYLQRSDYFVTLISPVSGSLLEQYRHQNIPTIIDPLVLDIPNTLEGLIYNYDVIFANTILSWQLVLAAKSLGKAVIWLIHEGDAGIDIAESHIGVQQALENADRVVFPSRNTQLKYQKFAQKDNYTTINYGLDTLKNYILNSPKHNYENSGKIRVVQVGSIEPRKGQDILVNCFKHLPYKLQNSFDFYFVGRILDQNYYKKLVEKTAKMPNVHWVGEVDHSDSLKYIVDSDVVVCTSRDETGPIFVMEAMCFGKGIISTKVGVVPDILEHEISALLIPVEDPKAVAESLVRLYQDRVLLKKLGEETAQKFESYLRIERYGQDIVELIDSIKS